jgi:hypothetical protein
MTTYINKTRNELILLCKEQKIKGYSHLKKDELIKLLNPKIRELFCLFNVFHVSKEYLLSRNTHNCLINENMLIEEESILLVNSSIF